MDERTIAGTSWVERCKKFRKQDADEYEQRIAELEAENKRLNEKVFNLKGDCAAYFASIEAFKEKIAELETEVKRLEIENWYHEVSELVQYNWWFEIIEDGSEVGKEELIKIFKRATGEAGRSIDV